MKFDKVKKSLYIQLQQWKRIFVNEDNDLGLLQEQASLLEESYPVWEDEQWRLENFVCQ